MDEGFEEGLRASQGSCGSGFDFAVVVSVTGGGEDGGRGFAHAGVSGFAHAGVVSFADSVFFPRLAPHDAEVGVSGVFFFSAAAHAELLCPGTVFEPNLPQAAYPRALLICLVVVERLSSLETGRMFVEGCCKEDRMVMLRMRSRERSCARPW